jgi:hypothetical protein
MSRTVEHIDPFSNSSSVLAANVPTDGLKELESSRVQDETTQLERRLSYETTQPPLHLRWGHQVGRNRVGGEGRER